MQTLPQLQAHVGAALNIGASPLQLRETIYQCAPYIGFPKTLNAIDIANGVFEASGISLPLENAGTVDATDPSAREQAGAAIQAPLYGNEVKEVFAALVQVMPYIGGPYALSGLVLVARYDESASAEAYR